MGPALLACRLILASVFLVAGLTKLVDRAGFRRTVIEFGVPDRAAGAIATAVPAAEIVVAAALITSPAARYGAVGGALLLLTFSVAIANARLHGKEPDCHCFGQLHSAPAGWRALGRNLILLSIAIFVVVAGWHSAGDSATAWVTRVSTAGFVAIGGGVVIAAVLSFQAWFSLQLLTQNGRMLARMEALERTLEALAVRGGGSALTAPPAGPMELGIDLPGGGLPVGTPAPGFELESVTGGRVSLRSLLDKHRPLILIFSATGCGPCNALLPQIAVWQRLHRLRLRIVVISSGDRDQISAKASEHGLEHVLLQDAQEVADRYAARGTPTAVLIGADGSIQSAAVGGSELISELTIQAAIRAANAAPRLPVIRPPAPAANGHRNGETAAANGPAVGDAAPELVLADLEGEPTAVHGLYGEPLLVIFWNPGCGFCQRMLPDLRALEDEPDPPAGAPRLLVISAGDPERVRGQQIRSRLLLDPDGQAMRRFGAGGTPMAVLVDATGRIDSPVLAGGPAVMAAARGDPRPIGMD